MTSLAGILRCPGCAGAFSPEGRCTKCDRRATRRGSILDFLDGGQREERAQEVEAFYQVRPFPGYSSGDDAGTLIDRARRSAFLRSLDESCPSDARVVDAGCGTGQLAAFLALSAPRRTVVGADGCRASLDLADGFRSRASAQGIQNLHLVRADLFQLPLEPGAFDVVVSRGVVHHTPDVEGAIRSVAALVKPGGYFVLGFYETAARGIHRARRALGRPLGKPIRFLDPILRRKDLDEEKKLTWIEDQYRHPLEEILPLPWVLRVLKKLGFTWVRTVPPAAEGDAFFEPTPEPSALGLFARRAGWFSHGLSDEDAGLVCVVARRSEGRGSREL